MSTEPTQSANFLKLIWDGSVLSQEFNQLNSAENYESNSKKRNITQSHCDEYEEQTELLIGLNNSLQKAVIKHRSKLNLNHSTRLLNAGQKQAFNLACSKLASGDQLIMLITGTDESGTSLVYQSIISFIFFVHGKINQKYPSVLMNNTKAVFRKLIKRHLSDSELAALKRHLCDTVLLVIDNIQLVSLQQLNRLNLRLGQIMATTGKYFGGLHVLLVGDLCQPVTKMHYEETHIMQYTMSERQKKALAGHKILLDSLTHCIDLSSSVLETTFITLLERQADTTGCVF